MSMVGGKKGYGSHGSRGCKLGRAVGSRKRKLFCQKVYGKLRSARYMLICLSPHLSRGTVFTRDIPTLWQKGEWIVRVLLLSMLMVILVGVGAIGSAAHAQGTEGKPERDKLRVGVFDSRAVAVAYAASEGFNRQIKQLMEEKKQAEAAGDQEKVKRLIAEGKAGQEQLHQQGFGTASVANILEQIKDQLPAIAHEAGVDLIVSKWDIAYQAPTAETVDITQAIVKPFHPSERSLKIIKDLEKHRPLPAEQLRNLRD